MLPRPRARSLTAPLVVLLMAFLAPLALAQPFPGTLEEWPAGSGTAGWTGGSNLTNPNAGGHLGAADGYLKITTTAAQNFGANSSNNTLFAGDYFAAGIDEVRLWLNDVGPIEFFEMHLLIGSGSNLWSYNTGLIPSHGSWTQFSVPLNGPVGWTQIFGPGTYQQALQTADRLLIRHDVAPYVQNPNTIKGDLGVDGVELFSHATPAHSNSWGRLKKLYR